MKVLIILDPVVPISKYNTVGSTNVTCQLCKELSKMGLDITLGAYWDDENAEMCQYVTPLNIYPEKTRVYMKKAFKIINDHLEENDYDSININISTPSVAKYLVDLNNKGTPIYFTMHSWTGTSAVSFHYKDQFTQLVNEDKLKFVFLCESQMRTLFDNIGVEPKNYIIEPNAILGEEYDISDSEAENFAKSILPSSFVEEGYMLSVSRLVKSKHPDAVIDAAVMGNHKLVLVGSEWINDLDYAKEVKDRVLNHPNNIYLIDELDNKDVIKLMKKALCTVLFTDMEVCNLTILESCIVGTPIVAGPSNGTGITDSLNNLKDGGVFPIEFPFRSKWEVKLKYLSDLMSKASSCRYDVSKFPECYKWKNHVSNYYKILTNNANFN